MSFNCTRCDDRNNQNNFALFFFSEKGQNHFEVLPEGWVKVTHNSGIPLYLHTQARVCTVSRPYFLGPGSVRVCKAMKFHLFRCY